MPAKFKLFATLIPLDQAVKTILIDDITEIRSGQF